MEVISDRCRLREVLLRLDTMDQDSRKIPLVAALRRHLCDMQRVEAVVDSWPLFSCVLLRPSSTNTQLVAGHYFIYYTNLDQFKEFLAQPGVILWNQSIVFACIPPELEECLIELGQKHGGSIMRSPVSLSVIHYSPWTLYRGNKYCRSELTKQLPPGFSLGTLRPEHASRVIDNWTYAKYQDEPTKRGLLKHYESVISRHVTSGVFAPSGELVAWTMMKADGSGGMTHTLEHYRNRKLFSVLFLDFLHQLAQLNTDHYGVSEKTNTAPIHVSSRHGVQLVADVVYLRYRPAAAHL